MRYLIEAQPQHQSRVVQQNTVIWLRWEKHSQEKPQWMIYRSPLLKNLLTRATVSTMNLILS